MFKTIISWTLTLALAGVAIFIYRPDLINKLVPKAATEVSRNSSSSAAKFATKKPKSKKTANATSTSTESNAAATANSTEAQVSKKRKIASSVNNTTVDPTLHSHGAKSSLRGEEGIANNRDFAQQLSKAQAGTKLQPAPQQKASNAGRQQVGSKQVPKAELSNVSTEGSSTAGRDADDDMSQPESSDDRTRQAINKAGDISDMLEAPIAKPTTLRLTGLPSDAQKPKQANKSLEPVLSKKKRNEQARREEQRLIREESERIHEAKKQDQLRRARMAAGTSNQTKANAFTSSANAWQNGKSEAVKEAPATSSAPLLDTFEPPSSMSKPNGAVHTKVLSDITNGAVDGSTINSLRDTIGEKATNTLGSSTRERTSRPTPMSKSSWADEMSEEDQIKVVKAQQADDAWESVTNKKGKKKGKQDADTGSEAGPSIKTSVNTAASKPRTNGNASNGLQKDTVNRFQTIQTTGNDGLQDDEWQA